MSHSNQCIPCSFSSLMIMSYRFMHCDMKTIEFFYDDAMMVAHNKRNASSERQNFSKSTLYTIGHTMNARCFVDGWNYKIIYTNIWNMLSVYSVCHKRKQKVVAQNWTKHWKSKKKKNHQNSKGIKRNTSSFSSMCICAAPSLERIFSMLHFDSTHE